MSGVRKSFYIVLPLVSCVVGILLVELGLALFYPIPFSLEKNMYFEPDPYTGYRHRALSQGYYPTGITAIANSRGHRDDEVDIPKPPGVFRILMLGDSFTVGANIEQAEAFPQQLEQILNRPDGPRIEVVNTGVGGWSPFQYTEYLKNYGPQFEPDLAVVGMFVGNDIYVDRFSVDQTMSAVLGRRVTRGAADNWWTTLRVLAYENSHIYRALMRIKPNDMDFGRENCADFSEIHLAIQHERINAHIARPSVEEQRMLDGNMAELSRMQAVADELGIKLLIVILPDENQINPALQARVIPAETLDQYDFDMPQTYIREYLASHGIAELDLLNVIRSDERCLFMNDTHWIPAGHRLVAERISDYLQVNGLVPQAGGMSSWPHKLDHIGLPVTDIAASKVFYTQTLVPQAGSMSSWPHKLDHIGLPVTDIAASKVFYTQTLVPQAGSMSSWPHKLDHIGLPVTDIAASKVFYTQALAPVGMTLLGTSVRHAAFGIKPMPYLTIRATDQQPASVHVAFVAETRAQVDAFYAAALSAGGTDNGRPGLRPDYHPDYYGAFVLDPDGHNIEVVKHAPE